MNLQLLEPPPRGGGGRMDAGVSNYYAYELLGSELNEWATWYLPRHQKSFWLFAVCGNAYLTVL